MPFPPVLNSEHNSQLQALQTTLGLFQQELHSNNVDLFDLMTNSRTDASLLPSLVFTAAWTQHTPFHFKIL